MYALAVKTDKLYYITGKKYAIINAWFGCRKEGIPVFMVRVKRFLNRRYIQD